MATLREGSTGPEVTKLQAKLNELGFSPGSVDGNFGPGTEAALIAFQQAKGLAADGIDRTESPSLHRTPPCRQACGQQDGNDRSGPTWVKTDVSIHTSSQPPGGASARGVLPAA